MEKYIKTGKVEGTGANIAIACGWKPDMVRLMNAEGLCTLDYVASMGDGKGYKVLTGIDSTTDTVSLHSFISTKGITLSDYGFTIGADTDINVSGEDIYYFAIREK